MILSLFLVFLFWDTFLALYAANFFSSFFWKKVEVNSSKILMIKHSLRSLTEFHRWLIVKMSQRLEYNGAKIFWNRIQFFYATGHFTRYFKTWQKNWQYLVRLLWYKKRNAISKRLFNSLKEKVQHFTHSFFVWVWNSQSDKPLDLA